MDILMVAITAVFIVMNLTFIVALWLKDNSIVDIIWGLGFVVIAATLALTGPANIQLPQLVVSALVFAWGLRLATHILDRKKGKPEDFRYANWRKTWKPFLVRSYFQIYILQGFLMLVIAAPLYVVEHNSNVIGAGGGFLDSFNGFQAVVAAFGIAVWLTGFYYEAVGDMQLKRFIASKPKKGSIMKSGLWAKTRHPNYFGEITMWWGIWLIVATLPFGIFAIISPITITFLLLKVSGVTLLEKKWDKNKEYQAYKKTTPPIFPKNPF